MYSDQIGKSKLKIRAHRATCASIGNYGAITDSTIVCTRLPDRDNLKLRGTVSSPLSTNSICVRAESTLQCELALRGIVSKPSVRFTTNGGSEMRLPTLAPSVTRRWNPEARFVSTGLRPSDISQCCCPSSLCEDDENWTPGSCFTIPEGTCGEQPGTWWPCNPSACS